MKKFKVELSWVEYHYGNVIIEAESPEKLKKQIWENYNNLREIVMVTQDTFDGFGYNEICRIEEIEKDDYDDYYTDDYDAPVASINKNGNIKSNHL